MAGTGTSVIRLGVNGKANSKKKSLKGHCRASARNSVLPVIVFVESQDLCMFVSSRGKTRIVRHAFEAITKTASSWFTCNTCY